MNIPTREVRRLQLWEITIPTQDHLGNWQSWDEAHVKMPKAHAFCHTLISL